MKKNISINNWLKIIRWVILIFKNIINYIIEENDLHNNIGPDQFNPNNPNNNNNYIPPHFRWYLMQVLGRNFINHLQHLDQMNNLSNQEIGILLLLFGFTVFVIANINSEDNDNKENENENDDDRANDIDI